jgi:hypothetical protein
MNDMTVPMKPVDYLHPTEKLQAAEKWISDVIKNGKYSKTVSSMLEMLMEANEARMREING